MKFQRSKKYDVSINITPLVDVVFLLLIFFVVTAVLENNYLLKVDLPRGVVDVSESELRGIEVVVSRDGDYFVNGAPILNYNEIEFESQLMQVSGGNTSLPITLSADGEVSHQKVVRVISVIKNTGFEKLQLAVKSTEESQ